MDQSSKKKSQKRMLIKLKSWTKKLVASPKSDNNNDDGEELESEDNLSQIAYPSTSYPLLDNDDDDNNGKKSLSSRRNSRNLTWLTNKSDTNNIDTIKPSTTMVSLSTEQQQQQQQPQSSKTSTKQDKLINSSRRNSFFGLRLNSRLNSCISRISSITTNNNTQQSVNISNWNLPELNEESFDLEFIFNDFDQLFEIDELDELENDLNGSKDDLNDSKNLDGFNDFNDFNDYSEILPDNDNDNDNDNYLIDLDGLEIYSEFYNALPVNDDDLNVPPPNPTTLIPPIRTSLIYPPSLSESSLRIECTICTYMNHPIMTFCELCNSRLPGSTRSSQYSITNDNNNINSNNSNNNNDNNNDNNNKPDSYMLLPFIKKTQMTRLKNSDDEYSIIKDLFYSEMPRGFIKGIVKLDMPTKLVKAHEKYKSKVAKLTGKCSDDVTFTMFHGTTTSYNCDPYRFWEENRTTSFCKKGCGMCGIIQDGNKKKYSKHSKKMWFAHSALISRDYTDVTSSTRVMFVVDVIAEEHNWILVVNKNKATLPRFMILFE